MLSFLEPEKRKKHPNKSLNNKRRREWQERKGILARRGGEKRMRTEKERWRFGRRREEVAEGKRKRDMFVYSDSRDFSFLIWSFLPMILPIVD
jgi:hypothetical protein